MPADRLHTSRYGNRRQSAASFPCSPAKILHAGRNLHLAQKNPLIKSIGSDHGRPFWYDGLSDISSCFHKYPADKNKIFLPVRLIFRIKLIPRRSRKRIFSYGNDTITTMNPVQIDTQKKCFFLDFLHTLRSVISRSSLQSRNAPLPILCTPSGIVRYGSDPRYFINLFCSISNSVFTLMFCSYSPAGMKNIVTVHALLKQ